MGDFGIDGNNYPGIFQLTKFGEAINLSQYLLEIAEIDKTSTFLIQDDQSKTRAEPEKSDYIDELAGFDDAVFFEFLEEDEE